MALYRAWGLIAQSAIRAAVVAGMLLSALGAQAATPDFSGTWTRFPDPYGDARFPVDPPPPGGEPQLKEPYGSAYKAYVKRKAEADEQGKPLVSASARCLPEGMPTLMGAVYDIEILQARKKLVVLAEFLAQTRRIYLDEDLPALADVSPSYNGFSTARWQGDTLVVQTIGVREDVKFFEMPHSAKMKITERLRLTAPDRLENRVRIDDPDVLAKPYEFTFGYKRDDAYRISEYICDDNRNQFNSDGTMSLKVKP